MRVISWNVNLMGGRDAAERKADTLGALEWDLALLQEVNPATWEVLRARDWFDDGRYGFDLTSPPEWKRPNAVAVLSRGLRISHVTLLESLPRPERGLACEIWVADRRFHALSWHAPNAAQSGVDVKMDGYRAVVEWLHATRDAVVLGCDTNHWARTVELVPSVEVPPNDPYGTENSFFVPDATHRLRDALVDVLTGDRDRYRAICTQRPDGPLEVSYRRGRRHDVDDRFDYVFVSPEIEVIDVRYDYDAGLRGGSDHAIVEADLEFAA